MTVGKQSTASNSNTGRQGPDFDAYAGIWETRGRDPNSWLRALAAHPTHNIAIVGSIAGLCYIGKTVATAGTLSVTALIGALVIAAMVLSIGVIALAASCRRHAPNTEETEDSTSEPGDERRGAQSP